ncbi:MULTISPECIES: hypothetical protein [unclassified Serratia (in: enterobacteria)]|uniref:hypothetical protein n=1 Tax=unclassified Serratia (in: enterobacteria) TaxID=2647522 RepID=UPI00307664BF
MKELSNSQANFRSLAQKKDVIFLLIAEVALVGRQAVAVRKKPDELSARLHFCGATLIANGASGQAAYGSKGFRSEQSGK